MKNYMTNPVLDEKTLKTFSRLPKGTQDDISIIFLFWNSMQEGGKWRSHRKLTPDMIGAVLESLKSYAKLDICEAINNYAMILQNDRFFWTHVWPLSIFLTVKKGPAKDAYKKWWQFLPENFVAESYLNKQSVLPTRNNKTKEPLPEDPDPQFTQYVISAWKQRIPMADKSAFPNQNQMKHFINFTIRAIELHGKIEKDKIKNSVAQEIIDILLHYKSDEAWRVKGGILKPWMLASDPFWNEYFPQWYKNAGLPLDCLTYYRDKTVFKKMVEDTEAEDALIQSNLNKQSGRLPSKPKKISDTDNPEFDYMKNV